MTPASSAIFFKPALGDFLYAPVGAEGNDMPLSVLSAFARLNLDPWQEASELSELSTDLARLRLISLIDRLPKARWTEANSGAIADRLIGFLPQRAPATVFSAEAPSGGFRVVLSPALKILIIVAIGIIAVTFATYRERAPQGAPADTPAAVEVLPSRQ